MIISIEGIDYAGKTTQIKRLKSKLKDATFLRFPDYTTPDGQKIKEYLAGNITATKNELIFWYGHSFLASKTILESSELVVTDRYTLSTLAYQHAPDFTWLDIGMILHDTMKLPMPDVLIYLDIDPEKAFQRKRQAKRDVMESDRDFMDQVYQNYTRALRYYPCSRKKIDATQTDKQVENEIWDYVSEVLSSGK